jgi:hypothetical protein
MENKWWEYYAVRYFVGTVVGALIIAFLNEHSGSPYEGRLGLGGDSKEATFLGVGLVAALGFAYCYIASSPVLTLHATRAHLRLSVLKESCLTYVASFVVGVGAAIFLAWQILPPLAAVGIGLIVGFQVALVLLGLLTKFSVIETFYRELADARAQAMRKKDEPPSAGLEYLTSYRHLREHGNAFMIVILEGVLAYALFHLPSTTCAFYFIAIWILPATLAWLLGTVLESRFASKPLSNERVPII